MQNAHLRLGQLEYLRSTTAIQTRVRLHVDRFVGEDEQGHLLSVYGGDAEVGAIAAAVYEEHSFFLRFPDGTRKKISMGQNASCYRAGIAVGGRRQSLRHLVIASLALHANGAAGKTYLLNYERTTAWATMASLLGVPAYPCWSEWILGRLELDYQVVELQGIGCEPVLVSATRDRLLAEISEGLKQGSLAFPEENGPIVWRSFRMQDLLCPGANSAPFSSAFEATLGAHLEGRRGSGRRSRPQGSAAFEFPRIPYTHDK